MLPREKRLHRKRDHAILGYRGRSIHGPFATLRFRIAGSGGPKVAFLTSTKVWKLAVDRNRVKRRFREASRLLWDIFPPNGHLLFVLKPEGKDAPFEKVQDEVRRLVAAIPDALQKPAKLSPRAIKTKAKKAQQRSASAPKV